MIPNVGKCCISVVGNIVYSETSYSGLWGKQGSFKEYEQAAKLFCYGLSSDEIADVLGKDVRTITTWLLSMGEEIEIISRNDVFKFNDGFVVYSDGQIAVIFEQKEWHQHPLKFQNRGAECRL
jgi:DNA-binding CsgD family transcriptional regulator